MEPGLLATSLHPSGAGITLGHEPDVNRRAELHDIVHSDASTDGPDVAGRETALPCGSRSESVISLGRSNKKPFPPPSSCVQRVGLD